MISTPYNVVFKRNTQYSLRLNIIYKLLNTVSKVLASSLEQDLMLKYFTYPFLQKQNHN